MAWWEPESFSDRVVNQRGILLDERIPGRFVAVDATRKESLLFLGHATCCSGSSADLFRQNHAIRQDFIRVDYKSEQILLVEFKLSTAYRERVLDNDVLRSPFAGGVANTSAGTPNPLGDRANQSALKPGHELIRLARLHIQLTRTSSLLQ